MDNKEFDNKNINLTLPEVREVIENYFELKKDTLKERTSYRNKEELTTIMQIAHYWCIENEKRYHWSKKNIGSEFLERDRSTIYYSIESINNLIDTNYTFKDKTIKKHLENINELIEKYLYKRNPLKKISKEKIDKFLTILNKLGNFINLNDQLLSLTQQYLKRIYILIKGNYKIVIKDKIIFSKIISLKISQKNNNTLIIFYKDFVYNKIDFIEIDREELYNLKFRNMVKKDIILIKELYSTIF